MRFLFALVFCTFFASAAHAQTVVNRYVTCSSVCANDGDGTTSSCAASAGAAGAYNEGLNTALGDEQKNIVTPNEEWHFKVFGDCADSTSVEVFPTWVTGSSNRLYIETDSSLTDSVHDGVWPTGTYRIEVTSGGGIKVRTDYATVDGIPIYTNHTGSGAALESSDGVDHEFKNLILRGNPSNSNANNFGINNNNNNDTGKVLKYKNILVYDFSRGFLSATKNNDEIIIYNVGVRDSAAYNYALLFYGTSDTMRVKNTWAENAGNSDNYYTESTASTEDKANVVSDNVSSYADVDSTTCTFENEASDNFKLASGDSNCKDQGTDLTSDANLVVDDDFIGTSRNQGSGNDIGPHELAASSSGSMIHHGSTMEPLNPLGGM